MNKKLAVCDVDWDGSHFTALSPEGAIGGRGSFTQNKASTGGTIQGQISSGPHSFIGKPVSIEFDGPLGVCVLLA